MCIYIKQICEYWIGFRIWHCNLERELTPMKMVAETETFDFIRSFKIIM